ncbi:ABC transporter permease subunit [Nocardioides sp.]|uniref:ABC transporter permease subunit n=1 Tax=Nocardioides sp. TaxID=35761 RepID=UPI003511F826
MSAPLEQAYRARRDGAGHPDQRATFGRLVRVELLRLGRRRAVLGLLLVAVLVPAITCAVLVVETRPITAAERAQAEQQRAEYLASDEFAQSVEDCTKQPADFAIEGDPDVDDAPSFVELCRDSLDPGDFVYERSPLTVDDEQDDGSGLFVVLVLGLTALLAAATSIGHDFATGSIANQLLVEPRRLRLLAGKLAALVLVAAVAAGVVLGLYWAVLNGVAAGRGEPAATASLSSTLQAVGRGMVFASLAALLGFALTALLRSTVGTLGVLVGTTLLLAIVPSTLGSDDTWNPLLSVDALASGSAETYRYEDCFTVGECGQLSTITYVEGLLTVGVILLVLAASAAWSFRRRDVR